MCAGFVDSALFLALSARFLACLSGRYLRCSTRWSWVLLFLSAEVVYGFNFLRWKVILHVYTGVEE